MLDDFYIQVDNHGTKNLNKINLSDNALLTDNEFVLVTKLCDIFIAIDKAAVQDALAPPSGGIFWSSADKNNGPFSLHMRKDRNEIDHSFLFNTRFRDFPSIAYEFDEYTPTPDFWVRRYIQLANAMPKRWQVKVPARFGEIGWNVDGYPVNRLTSINQERLNAMYIANITTHLEKQDCAHLLEIGAGAGEMGYTLCKALPNCTWFDCDLLGSLVYSAIHLAVLLPEKQHKIYVGQLQLPAEIDESLISRNPQELTHCQNTVVHIPSFLMDDFVDHLDLHFAYNTYSFGEMPKAAVENYINLLANFLKKRGILLDQNGDFAEKGGTNAPEILSNQFKQLPWQHNIDSNKAFLNGPIRIWYNNEMNQYWQNLADAPALTAVLGSLHVNSDRVDIEYAPEAWGKIAQLFPCCI
jgi:putative sugar O-methyltransferase